MDIEIKASALDRNGVLRVHEHEIRTWRRPLAWIVLLAGLTVGGMVSQQHMARRVRYVTTEVTTGALTVSVTATGNLKPRRQVEIGSEISGLVERVHVDVNDRVRRGQLLASLDTTRLKAQLSLVEAAAAVADARVAQAEASLREATAYHARLLMVRTISDNRLPSQQAMDLAEASLARSKGGAAATRAAVAQARAIRETVRADLAKTQIRSPIDGVVLVRSIQPGQTVAASFHAPVLFVLAEDLRRMELHVAVDEADIGAVRVGHEASFTVDAYPDRVFVARITRIHTASNNTHDVAPPSLLTASSTTTAAAVVTYETVLEVDNADLWLRPGMTATAAIVTGTVQGVTRVSNAAMRFTPDKAQFPVADDDSERGRGVMALVPYLADRWKCPRQDGQALGCVWVLEDGEPQLVIFTPGATDRSMTQVLSMEQLPNWSSLARLRSDPVLLRALRRKLTPGTQVIVGSAPYR